jgi:protein gp37
MNDVSESIGWCSKTLNPVVGCKRGCRWKGGSCYAKRNYNRFKDYLYEGRSFEDVTYFPFRMQDACLWRLKEPTKIFLDSMSDIEYWEKSWKDDVIKFIRENRYCDKHTFMILSKRYKGYADVDWWPKNVMQGLTLTGSEDFEFRATELLGMLDCPRPFLSVEPLLGMFTGTMIPDKFELVIVGALSDRGAPPPDPKWIEHVKELVPEEKIFWKNNIKRYL